MRPDELHCCMSMSEQISDFKVVPLSTLSSSAYWGLISKLVSLERFLWICALFSDQLIRDLLSTRCFSSSCDE